MNRFNWTEQTEDRLIEVVETLTQAGFHRYENPKMGGWQLRIGFWNAVAVGLILHAGLKNEYPSPKACQSRFLVALDRVTDPDGSGQRTRVSPEAKAAILEMEKAWQDCTLSIADHLSQRLNEVGKLAEQLRDLADYE